MFCHLRHSVRGSGAPVEVTIVSDTQKLPRLLRSLLIAAASLLIIASAVLAGNALAPVAPPSVLSQSAEDDSGEVEDVDEGVPDVETPEADDDEDRIDGAQGMPTAEDVERDAQAKEEDDQGEDRDDADDDQGEDRDDADESDEDDGEDEDDGADEDEDDGEGAESGEGGD